MQLYFIRHAQSANNALWDRTGASQGRSMDPEVTGVGKQQAELLARFLSQARPGPTVLDGSDPQNVAGFGITDLYSSLMERAVYTASQIGEALGLPVHAWVDLHEEGGIYLDDEFTGKPVGQAGSNRAYLSDQYPRLVLPESLGEDGWWNRPYEAYDQRMPRARRFLEEILARHGSTCDRVAVVSHGGFYNFVMAAVLGLPGVGQPWFRMNNCAITRIDFIPDGVVVIYQNRLDYMPREQVT